MRATWKKLHLHIFFLRVTKKKKNTTTNYFLDQRLHIYLRENLKAHFLVTLAGVKRVHCVLLNYLHYVHKHSQSTIIVTIIAPGIFNRNKWPLSSNSLFLSLQGSTKPLLTERERERKREKVNEPHHRCFNTKTTKHWSIEFSSERLKREK